MFRPLLIVAAAFGLCLAGCQSNEPTATSSDKNGKKHLIVGFAQTGAESSWRTAETESMKKEAAKRGAKLLISFGQGQQDNEIKAIRSFISQKVDAIVLAPIVETGWDTVLSEAKKAGIPVILVDRGVKVEADDSLYVTLIASDFVAEGEMAAEWLGKKMGGKGNVVELKGTTGAAPAIDREKGFHAVLEKSFPDMKIIASQTGDFKMADGKKVMQALIKANGKEIQAVYAHNDDMALGAIQALEEANMNPGKDVSVISIDGVKGAFEAMVKGTLSATVECNPLFGPITFDTLDKALAGEKLPKYIKNADKLFDQSTAAQVIGSREY